MRASVFFADDSIKNSFLVLNSRTTEDRKIHDILTAAFDAIAAHAFCGTQVPKRLILKSLLREVWDRQSLEVHYARKLAVDVLCCEKRNMCHCHYHRMAPA